VRIRLLLTLFLLVLPSWAEDSFTAFVTRVADGDTLTITVDGHNERLRLYGIDCPEKKQPFGDLAKQFTAELAESNNVIVALHGTDHYGRLLGDVTLADGKVLNRELIKAGWAWWYREYVPLDSALEELETDARRKRLGLWADDSPIAPWNCVENSGPEALSTLRFRPPPAPCHWRGATTP
jgi:endonuclease YncB( thermonuclease family)